MKKIGLALSVGGPPALIFHMCIIRQLLANRIPIDMIAGSSAGCFPALLLGLDIPFEEAEDWLRARKISDYAGLDLTNDMAFLTYHNLIKYYSKLAKKTRLEQFRIPVAIVLTELETCKKIVVREGDAVEAATMAFSLPGIFSPYKRNRSYVIDGGLVEPIPVQTVRDLGADIVISVNGNAKNNLNTVNKTKLSFAKKTLDRVLPQGLLDIQDMTLLVNAVAIEQKNFIKLSQTRSDAEIKIDMLPYLEKEGLKDIPFFKASDYQYNINQWAIDAVNQALPKIKKLLND